MIKKNIKIIKNARKNKINKNFANSSIEYKKLLLHEIVLDANNGIKILNKSFNNYFYYNLLSSFEKFLNKNKNNTIEIITNENRNNKLAIELIKKYPKQVNFYYLKYEYFPIDKDNNCRIDFIVNDNNSYRYEYNEYTKNKKYIIKTITNFNNPEVNQTLNQIFNRLRKIANKIHPIQF